jgi:hypothetical protein
VSLNSCLPAAFVDSFQKPTDDNADSQVRPNQFFHYLLKCIEVRKDSRGSFAVSLIQNQSLNIDVVLVDIALTAIPDIDRIIFQADSQELLKLRG